MSSRQISITFLRTRARDIDSVKEWDKMIKRLVDNDGITQITVYADMKTIESVCKRRQRGDQNGDSDSEGLSDEESQLVRL